MVSTGPDRTTERMVEQSGGSSYQSSSIKYLYILTPFNLSILFPDFKKIFPSLAGRDKGEGYGFVIHPHPHAPRRRARGSDGNVEYLWLEFPG
jgi:hypothetical protein